MRLQLVLAVSEWERGERVGLIRLAESIRMGSKPRFPYKKGEARGATHTYGARGEAAFAQSLGLPWKGHINNFKEADVEPNWEVRTTSSTRYLKVDPRDHDDRLVAFVLNDRGLDRSGTPSYRMLGYIIAGWAQRNYPLRDVGDYGNPAHFVRERDIVPFADDFHDLHGWARLTAGEAVARKWPEGEGRWACAFCPTMYEGETP